MANPWPYAIPDPKVGGGTVTDAELIAELASPAYAGMTAAQKVDALNAPKQGVNFPVMVPKATVALVLDGSHAAVAALVDPVKKEVWTRRFDVLLSLAEGVRPVDIADMLAAGVADGVMTSQQVATLNALGTRAGSRAEELWGESFSVSLNDVARVS